jgi:chloramphenicol 3-O phosphotransferase
VTSGAGRLGRVVVLNGSSSSGKTAIARRLQMNLEGTWLLVGVDLLLWMLPGRLVGSNPDGLLVRDGVISRGDEFMRLYEGFHRSIAALAVSGIDVLVDEAMLGGADDQALWDAALRDVDVCWIGVRCDADVVAAREATRGDRAPATARAQVELVHRGMRYDFEVDTTHLDAPRGAQLVAEHLRSRWSVGSTAVTDAVPPYPLTSAWRDDGSLRPAPWEQRPRSTRR